MAASELLTIESIADCPAPLEVEVTPCRNIQIAMRTSEYADDEFWLCPRCLRAVSFLDAKLSEFKRKYLSLTGE
jgi:hypothetical protein